MFRLLLRRPVVARIRPSAHPQDVLPAAIETVKNSDVVPFSAVRPIRKNSEAPKKETQKREDCVAEIKSRRMSRLGGEWKGGRGVMTRCDQTVLSVVGRPDFNSDNGAPICFRELPPHRSNSSYVIAMRLCAQVLALIITTTRTNAVSLAVATASIRPQLRI